MSAKGSSVASSVLASVGAALGGDLAARRAAVAARLDAAPRGPLPAAARGAPEAAVELFASRARGAAARIESVAHPAALPMALATVLAEWQLPDEVVADDEPILRTWLEGQGRGELRFRAVTASDRAAVVLAAAAVAETGTVVLRSGPDHATGLAFLPDYLIVLLPRSRVVGSYEEAFAVLRGPHAPVDGALPRCINFITGPSRTADIEEILLLGAHGPRTLLIFLIESA
jgi:L-lactate dehydrogenase complex protein LldG